MDRLIQAMVVVIGVPLATVGYVVVSERLLSLLSDHVQLHIRPWVWLAPTLAFLAVFLVYPSINTVYLSFLDATSTSWLGLANYRALFLDPTVLNALRNNLIWLLVFTSATVAIGLLVAVLADRVPYEGVAKTAIFLPMAVSFVAAGVIWKLVYDYRPPPLPQTGSLNAFLTAVLPGFEPQAWFVNNAPFNNLALIAAAVWVWTGFCTVILSAGLKSVPAELIEAARVDGATEWQVFRMIIVPMLGSTIAVVTTTMIIFALKAFDIVYVTTNGNFDTEVLANRMYKEMFNVHDFGRASALAVLLLLAIVPVMILNVRRFRQQEEMR
ncbi:MAG: ABC-type transporter, integral rane subunit [Chloroflexi bacterium]|nr:ABC-type transporter, integral rane subunit [Chloroflexota bacterium]